MIFSYSQLDTRCLRTPKSKTSGMTMGMVSETEGQQLFNFKFNFPSLYCTFRTERAIFDEVILVGRHRTNIFVWLVSSKRWTIEKECIKKRVNQQ